MPRGQQTTPEIQWAIVWLAKLLDHEQIGTSLNLSTCSVKQILAHFHQYGTIPNPGKDDVPKEGVGRRRHLSDVDVEFLLGTVQKAPDLYLDELQEMLQVSCGTQVSCATVWKTFQIWVHDEKNHTCCSRTLGAKMS
ncbi:hypothetical protein BS17DRAFT_329217 [Gyrodon lividus]|nr:hypothetical protein BS17DRAFT_329217 [Gyrodon lividus]